MSVLHTAYTFHEAVLAYVPLKPVLAGGAPNPAPSAPPGLSGRVNTLLGWWKWIALALGVFGLVGCGAMMIAGQRNRHNLAADGATGIPWVLGGLTLIVLSSGIAGVFYG